RNYEWHGVHTKPRDAELQPASDDLPDFISHSSIAGIEIRLMRIEAMVVIHLRFFVPGPGGFLFPGEHHAFIGMRRLLLRPHVILPVLRVRIAAGLLKPRVV